MTTINRKLKLAFLSAVSAIATHAAAADFPEFSFAKDVLVEKGVAPEKAAEIVQNLAGTQSVRVLKSNGLVLLGNALTENAREFGKTGKSSLSWHYSRMSKEVADAQVENAQGAAYTLPLHLRPDFLISLTQEHAARVTGECYIRIDETMTPKAIISFLTRIPQGFIENDIISKEDLYMVILLHELSHCSKSNLAQPDMREIKADIGTLQHFAAAGLNPKVAEMLSYIRAMPPALSEYSSSVPLDAAIHGRTPVTFSEVMDIYKDINPLFRAKAAELRIQRLSHLPFIFSAAKVFDAILKNPPPELKSNTKRFMELMLAGAKAIAPKRLEEVLNDGIPAAPAPIAPRTPQG